MSYKGTSSSENHLAALSSSVQQHCSLLFFANLNLRFGCNKSDFLEPVIITEQTWIDGAGLTELNDLTHHDSDDSDRSYEERGANLAYDRING